MPGVRVRNAVKRYDGDILALDDVTFDVDPGEFVALLGPSGCGKSTLLNLIGGIDLPTRGHVIVAGSDTSTLSDDDLTVLRRDRVGTVFQFFNLIPTLTIAENVGLPLLLQGRVNSDSRKRVDDALAHVGLSDRATAFPSTVSGGQLQRAAIARAVIHRPDVVLADEPTGNLDSRNGTIVLELLRTIANQGQTIVMATHSEEAAAYADRRLLLRDGKLVG
jgi:putative ABC transport system ATP-binding protein